jgi:hypothetical protein
MLNRAGDIFLKVEKGHYELLEAGAPPEPADQPLFDLDSHPPELVPLRPVVQEQLLEARA